MLVLSRKQGERIVIGSNIEIDVIAVCGSRVKIGIRAPRDVSVHREEIHRRIESQDRAARGIVCSLAVTESQFCYGSMGQ